MCLEESRRGPGPPLMVSGSKEEGGRGQTKRERRGSGAGGQARPRLNSESREAVATLEGGKSHVGLESEGESVAVAEFCVLIMNELGGDYADE